MVEGSWKVNFSCGDMDADIMGSSGKVGGHKSHTLVYNSMIKPYQIIVSQGLPGFLARCLLTLLFITIYSAQKKKVNGPGFVN